MSHWINNYSIKPENGKPWQPLWTGLLFPATMGTCYENSCAGLITTDDGLVHDVSAVSVNNTLDEHCVVYHLEALKSERCRDICRIVCQYDPSDIAGKVFITL